MDKGILVADLLDSDVFKLQFDYDEWPQTHENPEKIIAPFKGSMFQIRDKYEKTFGNRLARMQNKEKGNKMFKIKYQLLILPAIGEHFNE